MFCRILVGRDIHCTHNYPGLSVFVFLNNLLTAYNMYIPAFSSEHAEPECLAVVIPVFGKQGIDKPTVLYLQVKELFPVIRMNSFLQQIAFRPDVFQ